MQLVLSLFAGAARFLSQIHNMKQFLLAAFILPLFIFGAIRSTAQGLPAGWAPGERDMMPGYLNSRQIGSGIQSPPASRVRTAAEWEEIQALTITWTSYTSVLKEIVRYAREECKVYIICSDSTVVKSYLTSNNIQLSNIYYVIAPFNSVWMRDYGQNTVYTNDVDSLALVDWHYNRPRPKDDTIPSVLARTFNIPLYETHTAPYELIHTGGNFMSDGLGTAFSSELVLDENPTLSSAQIDTIMNKFMGISRYIKMETLPYDGIHHIDMHMKLLDEQTLLVGQYPQGVSDGPQIEANLQYVLSTYNSYFGTPYKVIRVPQPPQSNGLYPSSGGDYLTYANAVFVNKTVLVPTYYAQYDTTALRIWRESLPGYRIVGINCNSTIQASGAIHCITHSIGVDDPLLITHQELDNTSNTTTPYQVDAQILHKSGIATATLYYSTDTTQPYTSVPMTLALPGNTWTGFIPAYQAGTRIYYYIHAQAVSGKQQVRPIVAPEGTWSFDVVGPASVNETQSFTLKPIYPNPSKGITCIPLSLSNAAKGKIALYDMLGHELAVIFEGEMAAGEKNYFINTRDIASGVYMVVVQTEEGRMTQRLLVR
jgi:agmatine/peptidylarginine deiminase